MTLREGHDNEVLRIESLTGGDSRGSSVIGHDFGIDPGIKLT